MDSQKDLSESVSHKIKSYRLANTFPSEHSPQCTLAQAKDLALNCSTTAMVSTSLKNITTHEEILQLFEFCTAKVYNSS